MTSKCARLVTVPSVPAVAGGPCWRSSDRDSVIWVGDGVSLGLVSAAKYAVPGRLPARSEAAVMASAETASEESAENWTSVPSSEPSGSMGMPEHTLDAWAAGSCAGQASVSIYGAVVAQSQPGTC